jgi:hypothetical protein
LLFNVFINDICLSQKWKSILLCRWQYSVFLQSWFWFINFNSGIWVKNTYWVVPGE